MDSTLLAPFGPLPPTAVKPLRMSSKNTETSSTESDIHGTCVDFAPSEPKDDSYTVDELVAIAQAVMAAANAKTRVEVGKNTEIRNTINTCNPVPPQKLAANQTPMLPLSTVLRPPNTGPASCMRDHLNPRSGTIQQRNWKKARSRSGCWTCRMRHKACPEDGIPCGTCKRLELPCDSAAVRPAYTVDKRSGAAQLQTIREQDPTMAPL